MQPISSSNSKGLQSSEEIPSTRSDLTGRSELEQQRLGYFHTLREICQQPSTLLATCDAMLNCAEELEHLTEGIQALLLTGSGSSEYIGKCLRLPLQTALGVPTQTIASGTLLTDGTRVLLPGRPALMVSFARSGDSPESSAALSLLLYTDPEIRHMVLTCNPDGSLAEQFRSDPRVNVTVLDERTNDRSLVMTSSFTSLLMAGRFLGMLRATHEYRLLCARLSDIVEQLIESHFDTLARIANSDFERAIFLAGAARLGAAQEASLKMLEMTAGRVSTMSETYLGLRHGPMSYLDDDSLVVCFLSSEEPARAYEIDLLRELDRKSLGQIKVVIGEGIPANVLRVGDVAIECRGLAEVGDESACVVDVVAGQLLGFFRCLAEGLRPDSPSATGVINRVVEPFRLHRLAGSPL